MVVHKSTAFWSKLQEQLLSNHKWKTNQCSSKPQGAECSVQQPHLKVTTGKYYPLCRDWLKKTPQRVPVVERQLNCVLLSTLFTQQTLLLHA